MTRAAWRLSACSVAIMLTVAGCFPGTELTEQLFPVLDPEPIEPPPAALGPLPVIKSAIAFGNLGDGRPGEVTLYSPQADEAPRPVLVWVLAINTREYYHQAFFEYMASWGYHVAIPAHRDFSFTDFKYHRRNVLNAQRTVARAAQGRLPISVDTARIAIGGYSVGGSMAAFAAAELPEAAAIINWATGPAPIWLGVDPDALLPQVTQPYYFLLGELDDVAPPDGWPAMVQSRIGSTVVEEDIIAGAVHLFFQQPSELDERNPPTTLTRREQLAQTHVLSRLFLDGILDIDRGD